ncbi:MAG: hypothetical protein GF355_02735 [Candidatus Eisenbacteria bacterium]|nr:hypothetical protein [Candidatus Eisenbacteria bacterium]
MIRARTAGVGRILIVLMMTALAAGCGRDAGEEVRLDDEGAPVAEQGRRGAADEPYLMSILDMLGHMGRLQASVAAMREEMREPDRSDKEPLPIMLRHVERIGSGMVGVMGQMQRLSAVRPGDEEEVDRLERIQHRMQQLMRDYESLVEAMVDYREAAP